MQDPLDTYVANLLRDKGQPDTEEARQALLAAVNDAIDQALIEALPLEQLDQLEEATQAGRTDDALLEKLLSEAGVHSEQVVSDTLKAFRDNYLKGGQQ